jgi:hypothetical protein
LRNMAAVPDPHARRPPAIPAERAVSLSPSFVVSGAGSLDWAVLRCEEARTAAKARSPTNKQRDGRCIEGRIPDGREGGQLRCAAFLLSSGEGLNRGDRTPEDTRAWESRDPGLIERSS